MTATLNRFAMRRFESKFALALSLSKIQIPHCDCLTFSRLPLTIVYYATAAHF